MNTAVDLFGPSGRADDIDIVLERINGRLSRAGLSLGLKYAAEKYVPTTGKVSIPAKIQVRRWDGEDDTLEEDFDVDDEEGLYRYLRGWEDCTIGGQLYGSRR
jgi:hypothetical protein